MRTCNTQIARQIVLVIFSIFLCLRSNSQCNQNYSWAAWANFTGTSATGTIDVDNHTVNVTMTSNFAFGSTQGIFGYGNFAGFNEPIPNTTVPRTTWAAGAGGTTTMYFSETVNNPVLLISSLGQAGVPVTIKLSRHYYKVFDGGGAGKGKAFF